MHAGVVEVVALKPPRVDKYLPPILADIQRKTKAAEVDLMLVEVIYRACGRIEDV